MPAVSKQSAFLKAFSLSGSITKAAEDAKVQRGMHYRWLTDPSYLAKFKRARREAVQGWEDEAIRRANDGVIEPVFYKGKACGAIRRYSDGLLMFLLRAAKPQKYRERVDAQVHGSVDVVQRLVAARKRLAEAKR